MRKDGVFITVEGIDGSGKSIQLGLVAKYLMERGLRNILVTAEPGGTSIGDELRGVVHDFRHNDMQPVAELLIYTASRAQLVGQKIRPHLAKGRLVLCDRYTDSTTAYQGYGRGLPMEDIMDCARIATGGLVPDLTVLFDIEPKLGLQRRKGGAEWNRMDAQDIDFYQRVRNGYLEMAAKGGRWKKVEAFRSKEEVFEEVKGLVIACLGLE